MNYLPNHWRQRVALHWLQAVSRLRCSARSTVVYHPAVFGTLWNHPEGTDKRRVVSIVSETEKKTFSIIKRRIQFSCKKVCGMDKNERIRVFFYLLVAWPALIDHRGSVPIRSIPCLCEWPIQWVREATTATRSSAPCCFPDDSWRWM